MEGTRRMQAVGAKSGAVARGPASLGRSVCAAGDSRERIIFSNWRSSAPSGKTEGAGVYFRSSARYHHRSVAFRAGRQRPHDRTRFPPNRLALLGIVPLLPANLETVRPAISLSHN